ncbi:hypothetical protein [Phaeobacter sp. CECT 5382]|uniref:hypothetical protein n=1 Tax=Phaeobacter sp. CECT 5382 TaxID=1712645 RepID=UPI00071D3CE7|nr:hypothetical protein [Phaeobacter sp. CECT 5382]
MQAFLLQEIISVSGWPVAGSNKKIIVLCTHSTEFIELLVDDIWADPVLAFRFARRLSDTWKVTGFFDVGGFGLGSDLTWQALIGFTYEINDRWSARAGYRHLQVYTKACGSSGLGG